MKILLTRSTESSIIEQLADAFGTKAEGRFINLPEKIGGGYITAVTIGDYLRILIRNFYLNEEVIFERTKQSESQDFIVLSFNNVFEAHEKSNQIDSQYKHHSVPIFSQSVSSFLTFPSDTLFKSVNIGVSIAHLNKLFGHLEHPIVKRILTNKENFAFEATITPDMMRIAQDLIAVRCDKNMEQLFFRLKAEEMLFYLFAQLIQREDIPLAKMHMSDIQAIYKIKKQLHDNLECPPNVAKLANEANMSEPKLRRLFKQTFGKSVFDYYQYIRMNEAAKLLKEDKLSVSETGYKLGFTNLSHFTRVFEQHFGMKPKKYSLN